MNPRLPQEAGLTLVEALVSLFIFALIASGGVLLLSQTLQAQARVESSQDELRIVQSTRALLAADFAQIAPRAVRDGGAQPVVFQGVGGARPSMSFVRAAGQAGSQDRVATRLVAIEYRLDDNGNLVRITRNAIDPGPEATEQSRLLVAAPSEAQFEFNDGGAWRTDWPAVSSVPRAVAISFILPRYGRVRLQALTGL